METEQQEKNLQIIRDLEEKINSTFREIPYDKLKMPFFLPEDLISLNGEGELKFRKMISYLYKLFIERSDVNFKTLADFSLSLHRSRDKLLEVPKTVQAFRTFFEHYLPENEKHSKIIADNCRSWYRAVLSKNQPETEDEWITCFERLFEEAVTCLKTACDILEELKNSSNNTFIFEQWSEKQMHNIPKHKKIAILADIKERYDLNYDPNKLFNKYQSRIDNALNLLDYDASQQKIDSCVYRILESIVLSIDKLPCPVSGKEVQEKYNIPPNDLEKLMKRVIAHYKLAPATHTKETLFEYIETLIKNNE